MGRTLLRMLLRATLRYALAVCLVACFAASLHAQAMPRVLVYTRNYSADGKGYVHKNIAESVAAIQRMGAESHFAVDVSEDPAVFTDANLAKYAALVFSNSNNEAFATEAQRTAFQHYIHAGHGFVGLHSAAGSEREWPYFQQVLGARFAFHPAQQDFTVHVADPSFAAMKSVPTDFAWNDECYFLERLNPGIHVVLTTDRTKLQLGTHADEAAHYDNPLPLAWYQNFDNSREFYLALGHNPEYYRNLLLYGMIERGILWAIKAKE